MRKCHSISVLHERDERYLSGNCSVECCHDEQRQCWYVFWAATRWKDGNVEHIRDKIVHQRQKTGDGSRQCNV